MPSHEDDESRPGKVLPDPDLNPMLNPLLGKHLGRWAQVYFTSPPEKREQAVQELLKELEAASPPSNGKTVAIDSSARTPSQADFPRPAASRPPERETGNPPEFRLEKTEPDSSTSLTCPACMHKNPPKQRFCGFCGFSLRNGLPETPRLESRGDEGQSAPSSFPPQLEQVRAADNWQWLHDKNLEELRNTHQTASWIKYFVGIIIAGVVVGGYFVLRSGAVQAPPKPAAAVIAQPVSTPPASDAPSASGSNTSDATSEDKQPPGNQPQGVTPSPQAQTTEGSVAQPSQPPPATTKQNSALPSADVETSESVQTDQPVEEGKQELLVGRRYLTGQGEPEDHVMAAKWLWRAVAKQNTSALLLLSDLYARGDGVPQSCDQARILLTSAVKKGSSEAAEKLQSLSESCK